MDAGSAAFLAFLGNLSMGEMVVIGVVALLVFGKRLPDVARSLGRGVTEFRRSLQGMQHEFLQAEGDAEAEARRPRLPAPATTAPDPAAAATAAASPPAGPPLSPPAASSPVQTP